MFPMVRQLMAAAAMLVSSVSVAIVQHGTLDGDRISGKGAWETYPLTFTASRAK